MAHALNNLANVYGDQGKYTAAVELYQRALAIKENALGADHPDVAKSLNNLAVVYNHQGKYAEAVELHRRALAIREQTLGPSHLDAALSLNNLAVTYQLARNPDLALASSPKATAAVLAHAATGAKTGGAGGLVEQRSGYFVLHVANLSAAARAGLYPTLEMGREGSEIARWRRGSGWNLKVA